ncbi:VWA domain-containing protein [Marinomonas sp. 2405UD68-3]|uniref:VWA domain-containing protein n=1 Tax=Marinomonas sp. 2405UD68-3 TaxID=3391835 RepID=UPI0039C902AD
MELLPGLYFTRPTWLLFMIIVFICVIFASKRTSTQTTFEHFIDPKLLPFLTKSNKRNNLTKWLGLACTLLAIIGLSGISWEKSVQPTYDTDSKTILLIDQSISLYATDIKPNRLTRLKQKLRDIIEHIDEGEIAMVAFAGDAYTISPFSSDKSTITHFLLALDPLIMPLYGSNLYSGAQAALSLLKNNVSPAHLIIFTDDVSETELATIPQINGIKSTEVSIIGVGTQQGGEIVLPDGTRLRKNNRLIKPSLPTNRLSSLATSLNGKYFDSQLSDNDIEKLTTVNINNQSLLQQSNTLSNIWVEKGHWLLIPFLIWLLIQFRPGAYLVLLISISSYSPESTASPLEWFMTEDQIAQKRVDDHNWEEASELFKNKQWQAASNYALEKYAEAADMLKSNPQTANDFYNLGNSLALSGQITDAITAYEKALELKPESQETKENLEYLKQQQKEQEQSKNDENKSDQNDQSDSQENDDQNTENQQQENDDQNTENQQQENDEQNTENQQQENDEQEQNEQDSGQKQDEPASQNEEATKADENTLSNEEKLALEQWLRQIQDDPGGLLKRKLWYLHQEKRAENRFKQEDGLPIW